MKYLKCAFAVGLIGAALLGAMVLDASAGTRISCGGRHALRVLDLDMFPDPVVAGQPIRGWRVRLQVDGSGECDTILQVKESPGNDVVGLDLRQALRPGINDITFRGAPGYQFQPRDSCFVVTADIAGTSRPVDAARRFCARYIPPSGPGHWTMQERGDRPVGR